MNLSFRFVLAFFLLVPAGLWAQSGDPGTGCGTASGRSAWLKKYQLQPELYEKNVDTVLYVPLTIHLLGTDEGEGFFAISKLVDALCTLNADFEEAKMQFFIEGDIHYIANSAWDIHDSVPQGAEMMFANNVPNTVNCYILTDPAGNCGYNLPYAGIALKKACAGAASHTWAHEMGHAFSLPHPFIGWEQGGSYDGTLVHNFSNPAPVYVTYDYTYFQDTLILDTLIIDTSFVERVDGSNCTFAADGFCDTPPDYLASRWACNAELESPTVQTDPAGVQFRSDATLIMSYSNDNCANRFSPQQIAAMRANLQDEKPELLDDETILPPVPTEPAALLEPGAGEVVPFNNVYLEWSPVEAATGYVIQISRLANFPGNFILEYAILDGSTNTLISDLENDRTYYWRVRAFNTDNFCAPFSAATSFKTSEINATDDPLKMDLVKVYPNPLLRSEVLQIEMATTGATLPTEIQLLDLTGRRLWQANLGDLPFNDNSYRVKLPANLSAGMYLLKIRNDESQWTEKIMVR